MTDSIKTTLKLTKIAPLVRMDIDAKLSTTTNPWGEVKERYTKPSHQKSALTETKTKWIVRVANDPNHPELGLVPTHIDAEVHVPNSTVGHNLEHGTSVWAAGNAAIEQQRIWMARSGLPQVALDLLKPEDVSLRGVTITYIIRCASRAEAEKLVEAINVTRKVLSTKGKGEDSVNLSVTLPFGTFSILAYIKTLLKHCKFPEEAPVADLVAETSCLVRIEVTLGLPFLEKLRMVELESWRHAYANGVYESIFNDTVRKELRLGRDLLRHKAPREEVFQKLTPTEAQLLRSYLENCDPRKFGSVVDSVSPTKRFSELRLEILRVTKIDIDIPWKEHVKLRCFELDTLLKYPGDYHPSAAHTPWCFCKANWRKLKANFRSRYEAELAAFIKRQELRYPARSDDSGDDADVAA